MSKTAPLPCVLSANRLADGRVVFLDFEGAWSEVFEEAAVAGTPDEAKALEDRGAWDAARNVVVEPYLVEVREVQGRPVPTRFRERVRVSGPSISTPRLREESPPAAAQACAEPAALTEAA